MDLKNLDKGGWKKYRFEQIANNISERVEPGETDLEIYVGLDHLDSDSIHIKRWGKPSDVEGTKLKVYPGDLIFGKRRAYQRKAAIATFEGICSAHAMVLRANPAVIDPQLFPFFIHSDAFMHRAVDISVGSLSPTINWSTLRVQEFLLPPKDQQARLAELLWAGDAVVEGYEKLKQKLVQLRTSLLDNLIKRYKTGEILLSEIAQVSYGLGVPPKPNNLGVPIIRATNIRYGEIFPEDMLRALPEDIPTGKRVFLNEGDIIVVRSGAYTGDIGFITSDWKNSLAGYDLVVNPDRSKIQPRFLNEFFLGKTCQEYFKSESTRSAQPHINAEQVRNTQIPIIEMANQKQYSERIENLLTFLNRHDHLNDSTLLIKKQLLNQIFTP